MYLSRPSPGRERIMSAASESSRDEDALRGWSCLPHPIRHAHAYMGRLHQLSIGIIYEHDMTHGAGSVAGLRLSNLSICKVILPVLSSPLSTHRLQKTDSAVAMICLTLMHPMQLDFASC